jgi:enamine deaminase RidA (YjgF/YER057c/UK114 family)
MGRGAFCILHALHASEETSVHQCQANDKPFLDVRTRRRLDVTEIFITASPAANLPANQQAQSLMQTVAEALGPMNCTILRERIFATSAAMPALAQARSVALSAYDDGVEPTWLAVPPNQFGSITGVQIHAVVGCGRPRTISLDGRPLGRLLEVGSWSYFSAGNILADHRLEPPAQARAMLAGAEALLEQVGASLHDVARTWLWLGGILDWYGAFNKVRSELFALRGLLGGDAGGHMPASTGIGIGPYGSGCCVMDFVAMPGQARPKFLLRAGRQDAASKYGSAFSRAAIASTPAGRTVYVSGTAAIDASGATTHIGDAQGQIRDTLENVQAVLSDAGSGTDEIVQAIVYCKTPQVESIFRRQWSGLGWPVILAIADVCRDNLLFEIEATAMTKDA